ncbi:MAG: DALR domain-containing protein, partial [Candidatus Macondimonas sp.]
QSLRGLPPTASVEMGAFGTAFTDAMNDDFNTPRAVAALFDMAREINRLRAIDPDRAAALGAGLRALGGVLGLLETPVEMYLQGQVSGSDGLDAAAIEALIQARTAARARKDWAEADRLRDALVQGGVVLEDGAGGTIWRRG